MKISFRKGVVNAVILTAALTCLIVTAESFVAPKSAPAAFASSSTKKFVKTNNRCTKCSCSGYWGYKHQNGTYEGVCSNVDKYGHTCKHSPEKHGLRKW